MKRVFARNKSEEGTALVTAAVGVAVAADMAAGIMIIGSSATKEPRSKKRNTTNRAPCTWLKAVSARR